MSDKKISQLLSGGASQAADEYPIARSGANFKVTGANIAAAATSVGTLTSLTVSGNTSLASSSGGVGIGVAAGSSKLNVAGTFTKNTGDENTWGIRVTDDTAMTTGVGGGLVFVGNYTSGGGKASFASIAGAKANSTTANGLGELRFYTTDASSILQQRAVIDGAGNLGLGVTPSYQFDLLTPTSATDRQAVRINYGTSVGRAVYFGIDAAVTGTTYIQSATPSSVSSGTDLALNPKGGNVGVGTDSPAVRLHLKGANNEILRLQSSDATTGSLYFAYYDSADSEKAYIGYGSGATDEFSFVQRENAAMVFFTNATERARITSGGYFKASDAGTYLGSTGAYHELRGGSANGYTCIVSSTVASPASQYVLDLRFSAATPNDTNARFWNCEDATATRAYMRSNGGLSNYQSNNTDLSDIRTKTDITPAASMWDKVAALEIVAYKYIDQTHDDVNLGVIAQQVETVEPVWVDADGFGETPEGEEPFKTVYTKDITFAAIKALQEAMARIEALEARLEALEA